MYNNKMHVMTEGALIRLVYDMAPGEVIRRFDNGMLSNNSIGGIVSFSVSYDNGNTRLIYSLNVRPALASMLRQNMTKNTVVRPRRTLFLWERRPGRTAACSRTPRLLSQPAREPPSIISATAMKAQISVYPLRRK